MKISLYKREGSKNWWLRYRDAEGALIRVSTGTPDEAAARELADFLETELAKQGPAAGGDDGGTGKRAAESEADRLIRRIGEIEDLMLTTMRYQAQAQEITAKRIGLVLRSLAEQNRQLEEKIDAVIGGLGPLE